MAPVRSYTNWNSRSTNSVKQIEPYRHYYFVCEGKNTEKILEKSYLFILK